MAPENRNLTLWMHVIAHQCDNAGQALTYVALRLTLSRYCRYLGHRHAAPFGCPKPLTTKPMAEGYCVKCKTKKEIAEAVEETLKNGRKAIKGKCPTCGTVMFKMLGGRPTPAAIRDPETPPPMDSPQAV